MNRREFQLWSVVLVFAGLVAATEVMRDVSAMTRQMNDDAGDAQDKRSLDVAEHDVVSTANEFSSRPCRRAPEYCGLRRWLVHPRSQT